MLSGLSSLGFPSVSPALEKFGLKFSSGGAHISRTMMLSELGAVLAGVPQGSQALDLASDDTLETHIKLALLVKRGSSSRRFAVTKS
jgi:hypothetical protein